MRNHINQIMIFRQTIGPTWTRGQLYLNGQFIGYTLEDTLRPFPLKIREHTAIPEGVYYARKFQSNTFGHCLSIDDVPMFTNIRIHGGNNDGDSMGCVLLGRYKNDEDGTISNCRPVLDMLLSSLIPNQPIVVSVTNAVGIT